MNDLAPIALGQLRSRLYNVRISVVINLPLRFWERAIPKADTSPDTLFVSLISNHVIPGLTPLAVSGTPLGYLLEKYLLNHAALAAGELNSYVEIETENRRNW